MATAIKCHSIKSIRTTLTSHLLSRVLALTHQTITLSPRLQKVTMSTINRRDRLRFRTFRIFRVRIGKLKLLMEALNRTGLSRTCPRKWQMPFTTILLLLALLLQPNNNGQLVLRDTYLQRIKRKYSMSGALLSDTTMSQLKPFLKLSTFRRKTCT